VILDRGRAVASGSPAELKRRIGGSVIELHATRPEDLPRIAQALTGLGDGAVQVDETTRRVRVGIRGQEEGLEAALRSVRAAGLPVEDIAMRQPNLDEVFMALTGEERSE
jgi:ABC-2 type transport system ATP-binding protein